MREVPPANAPRLPRATLLDRVIGWASPERGLRRLQARAQNELLVGALGGAGGAWSGASKSSRRLASWNVTSATADAESLPDLQTLRDRSRDLVKNNPLAAGAINTCVTRVIGTGLAMTPAIDASLLGLTDEQAEAWQDDVRHRWAAWAESTCCDITEKQDFYGLQALAMRSAFEAGDCFGLLPLSDDPSRVSPLLVKLVEADRVANPRGSQDTVTECAGIRMNEDGAPIAAHILRQHPGSIYNQPLQTTGDWVDFIGADSGRRQIVHVMERRRIGLTRGIPYLAAVIEPLKQISRFTDAELETAVFQSFFAVFVKHPAGQGFSPLESATSGQYQQSDAPTGSAWDGKLSSGLAVDLPEGSDVEFADPNRPNVNFDPFVQAVLRQVGVALEIPFELLIKHFTSSYTAARAALLDFWLVVRSRRAGIEQTFCQPIYEEWLRIEIAMGRIAARGYFRDPLIRHAWSRATWTGDAMGVLDPQREIGAVEKAIDLKLTTRERETMLRDGSRFQDNIEQLRREQRAIRDAGLEVAPAKPAAASAPANDSQQQD